MDKQWRASPESGVVACDQDERQARLTTPPAEQIVVAGEVEAREARRQTTRLCFVS